MAKRQHKIKIFLSIVKIPCFCQKNSKNPEKLIVFQGFYSGQHFYPLNMVYVTGLELTILTNLLFIMIPQGYLLCAKLFMILDESFILISSDCVFLFWLAGQFLFYTIGVFFSRLIGKPLFNHATIAWFSLYQKKQIAFQRSASYILLVFK